MHGTRPGNELAELERELARWRRDHGAPTPIPSRVWEKAAALAAEQGVHFVARSLKLNPTQLKRKMEGAPDQPSSTATFIELLPSISSGISECALEVESSRGSRMRVVMKNVPPHSLASILREFAG